MKQSIARGAIAWMASHKVAANLLMLLLLLGGSVMGYLMKQEVFPDFALDTVNVSMIYPGASPEEVEQGAILAIEEAVRGLDGIKEMTATANEGTGTLTIELLNGANPNRALQDVKAAVDRITTLPLELEKITVSLASRQRAVLTLAVHGSQSETALRALAESIRAELLTSSGITVVNLSGVRNPEISIEVPEEKLRAHNLTLQSIANVISASSLELPGGKIKSESGEILLRTSNRAVHGREFVNLPILTLPDGSVLHLKDIAVIKETFEDSDISTYYNGKPAANLNVFRVGDQKPNEISQLVREKLEGINASLPAGVEVAVWNDMSEVLQDRKELLFKNTFLGLILVLLLLALFLEPRLAFWVTMGIPISILGSLLFLPSAGASINMISLFAFIITIGVVVDDAVVVGEHIFSKREEGYNTLEAAISGAREMAVPVTFSILTNVVAFMPLFFVPGVMGKMFVQIPLIVITIFLISLFEALFILPAHLSHGARPVRGKIMTILEGWRTAVGRGMTRFTEKIYQPFLNWTMKRRYLTVSFSLMVLLIVSGVVLSGRIPFIFFPKVEGDVISVSLAMPIGTPATKTDAIQRELMAVGDKVLAKHGGDTIVRGSMVQMGIASSGGGPGGGQVTSTGGHLATVRVFLVPSDQRTVSAEQVANEWRNAFGQPLGVDNVGFTFEAGPSSGAPIHVALSHRDPVLLEAAAADLALILADFDGVKDIDDGFSAGKRQWDFNIKPSAQALGLTSRDVAAQVRAAFYGAEAQRAQRDRDEVKVFVRYPESERRTMEDVRGLTLRTPTGKEIPLLEAAEIETGRAYTQIQRRDGHRVINVTADVERGRANATKIIKDLKSDALITLSDHYPGLSYSMMGESKAQSESMESLAIGFGLALFVIFALLAIPFNSYYQPLIIMVSIPFGMVGAVLGHMLMGYTLSLMSMMGIVALTGVVVNDSLILIVKANRNLKGGMGLIDSVRNAGISRFRPIIITSLSTFFGLAPMILETSVQARFLIPMAISLGFGILFATLIALVFVPSFYLILEDVKDVLKGKEREAFPDMNAIEIGCA